MPQGPTVPPPIPTPQAPEFVFGDEKLLGEREIESFNFRLFYHN
jgi:hypothetical protein